MHKAATNPFRLNPLSRGEPVKLVVVPDTVETHETRKPMRSYLAAGGSGMSLDGLMSGGQKPKKPLEVIKTVYRTAPHDDDSDE